MPDQVGHDENEVGHDENEVGHDDNEDGHDENGDRPPLWMIGKGMIINYFYMKRSPVRPGMTNKNIPGITQIKRG